jgi:O-antigen/teichoic acid export membrane protein
MNALDEQEPERPTQAVSRSMAERQAIAAQSRGPAATFARNSFLSVSRLFASAAIALILPGYLTHKLDVKTYAAWVLILQVSAYVSYLDFGIQSGISKYVAEYEARDDRAGASMRASAGLALMLIASALGVGLTSIVAWQVPHLFHNMPATLYHDVRASILLVGVSLSFGLLCSIFSSIFFGLQRYAVPTILSLINRVLFTAGVLAAAALHQSLIVMGALVALVNVLTGILQFEAWRRMAYKIRLSLYRLDLAVVWKMVGYCSSLAIWTAGVLCVTGLDVTIVGRYDFAQTAFYSIATLPTNFMISIIGAALAPLMPTASALSIHRTPVQMGALLYRITGYASILLITSGLPLLVAGYWALRVWVGPTYAASAIGYLRILVVANIIRNACLPYATMLIATDSQKTAIAAVVAEALVNIISSIYLARHLGAIGVAYGTLIGSFVSVSIHFTLSMHYTCAKFAISRPKLFFAGFARPGMIAMPSLLLVPYWWTAAAPGFGLKLWLTWGLSTLLLAWFVGLNAEDRSSLLRLVDRRIKLLASNK